MSRWVIAVAVLALGLTGCAACRERPVMCAAAVVVAGVAAAQSMEQGSQAQRERVPTPAAVCAGANCY